MIYDREECASWPDMLGLCCVVCGRYRGFQTYSAGAHHIPNIGTGKRSEWQGALIALCGSGTTGCHGQFHSGKLELKYMNGWHWKGTNANGLTANEWVPCHSDSFWNALGGCYE